jgi:hypothetical protein
MNSKLQGKWDCGLREVQDSYSRIYLDSGFIGESLVVSSFDIQPLISTMGRV